MTQHRNISWQLKHEDFFRHVVYHLSLNSKVVRPARKKVCECNRNTYTYIPRSSLFSFTDITLHESHSPLFVSPLSGTANRTRCSRQLVRNIAMHSQIIEFHLFEICFAIFSLVQCCFDIKFITYFPYKRTQHLLFRFK